jgi:hypothetical protein
MLAAHLAMAVCPASPHSWLMRGACESKKRELIRTTLSRYDQMLELDGHVPAAVFQIGQRCVAKDRRKCFTEFGL